MFKRAGIEETKVSDPGSGKRIYISTTARIAFRKAWPKKAGVRNHILNDFIANMFAGGSDSGKFKPKSGDGSGKIKEVEGGRFIAIESGDSIKVIAIKGTVPDLPELPDSYKPPSLGGTSISDSKDPGAGSSSSGGESGSSSGGSGSSPAQLEFGLSTPNQPKHHIVPSFPNSPTATNIKQDAPVAPITPVAPQAPVQIPMGQPPIIPAGPQNELQQPLAPQQIPGAAPPVAPNEQPDNKPGWFDRLKNFIGIGR